MELHDRDEKKEAVKAQIRELIRSKTAPLEEDNRRLSEEISRLEAELDTARAEQDALIAAMDGDQAVLRKAGRIIIDAHRTAQRIISDAEAKAAQAEKRARLICAEDVLSDIRRRGSEAMRRIDASIDEVSELIRSLGENMDE